MTRKLQVYPISCRNTKNVPVNASFPTLLVPPPDSLTNRWSTYPSNHSPDTQRTNSNKQYIKSLSSPPLLFQDGHSRFSCPNDGRLAAPQFQHSKFDSKGSFASLRSRRIAFCSPPSPWCELSFPDHLKANPSPSSRPPRPALAHPPAVNAPQPGCRSICC